MVFVKHGSTFFLHFIDVLDRWIALCFGFQPAAPSLIIPGDLSSISSRRGLLFYVPRVFRAQPLARPSTFSDVDAAHASLSMNQKPDGMNS